MISQVLPQPTVKCLLDYLKDLRYWRVFVQASLQDHLEIGKFRICQTSIAAGSDPEGPRAGQSAGPHFKFVGHPLLPGVMPEVA